MYDSAALLINRRHFSEPLQQTWPKTIRGFSKAVYTIFSTPPTPGHDDSLYIAVARSLHDSGGIISQPPLAAELAAVNAVLAKFEIDRASSRHLSHRELLGVMGILMQFSSYLPDLRPYCKTPFADVEALYSAVITSAVKAPLDFSGQLAIALDQTSGDVLEALWRLFITTRLYARWFDTSVITGMPELSRSETLNRMETFWRSVAACKSSTNYPIQDTGGDTYYCWTHALAKVLYKLYAPSYSPIAALEAMMLRNGTRLNHGLAHRYKPQRLPSDHTLAATYGNAIGELLIQSFRL